jgi:hypothetical protein
MIITNENYILSFQRINSISNFKLHFLFKIAVEALSFENLFDKTPIFEHGLNTERKISINQEINIKEYVTKNHQYTVDIDLKSNTFNINFYEAVARPIFPSEMTAIYSSIPLITFSFSFYFPSGYEKFFQKSTDQKDWFKKNINKSS